MKKVTDPALLDQLNGRRKVMDPALLEQLNSAPMSTGEDVARSGATGLRQGVESGVGMFGDAANMQGDLGGWIAKQLGAGSDTQATVRKWSSRLSPFGMAPSTEQLRGVTTPLVKAAGAEGVLDHAPEGVAGEYSRTLGQFAPSLLSPGTLARKVATTVVPALASETAGQLTKGTDYEPYARAGGALLGGVAAAGSPAKQAVAQAAHGAATGPELKSTTDALYGALRNAGIRYDANEFTRMATDLPNVLHKANVRPVGKLKEAFDWAGEVQKLSGKSPDFEDINSLRTAVGDAARDAYRSPEGKSLGRALDIVKHQIDDFEGGAPLVSNVPLPKAQFDRIRSTARNTALRVIKQRALDDVMQNADTYQSGQEAGIRNGIGNLLRSGRGKQLFGNGAERDALLEVAQGRKALRTLSRFGLDIRKWSGNATFLPTMGAAATGAGLGLPVAGGLLAAGTIAKTASPMLTKRAFERAAGAIRSGGLLGPQSKINLRALQHARLGRAGTAGLLGVQSARTPVN